MDLFAIKVLDGAVDPAKREFIAAEGICRHFDCTAATSGIQAQTRALLRCEGGLKIRGLSWDLPRFACKICIYLVSNIFGKDISCAFTDLH